MRTEFGRARQIGNRVQVYLEMRDLWVGVYWDWRAVYVIVVPTVVIRIAKIREY